MTAEALSVTELSELTAPQLAALRALPVTGRQACLGKSFPESLDDWQAAAPGAVLGLCVLLDGTPVGLTLFRRVPAQAGTPATASIHGLKIALPWQGRGWGHAALRLAVAALHQRWPEVRRLTLAVDADNAAALAVYRRFGMTDSGPVDGNHGPEHYMTKALDG
ncbi:GNAT family N-acetyltransferase [Marinovum sp.]|uniref:GNAT family N-acetyltransferase n=1 Tax=Marinovum sp. TaxID=2024839 RepID=UPI002B273AAF|nr:GNAT family N-acetyltransferase [Marinovum sp.]